MDKPISSSGLKLPLGYRFHPTDEELLLHYLKRKVMSLPLPAPAVSDFDVFETHPLHLPGDLKEKRYFFSQRKGNVKKFSGGIIIPCNDFGYWKAMGKDEIVVIPRTNQAIGIKRSFVFYEGRLKTQWFMDQYCLVVSPFTPNSLQRCIIEIEDWLVSRVYQKKSKAKKKGVKNTNKEENRDDSSIMDLMMEDNNSNELGPPQPSSSSEASCCTVSALEEEEEECSAYIKLS